MRGGETGSQRTHSKVAAGGRKWVRWQMADRVGPHLCVDKPGGTTGDWDRPRNPGFQRQEIKPQNLRLKTPVGVAAAGGTPSLTRELVGETHRVLERTHPLPGSQHQKGPIWLWAAGQVTESQLRAQQAVLFSLGPLSHIQRHRAVTWVAPPWRIPKALPLTT